jgi:hypothetical integral membrane protein (TIGR02206 family)
VRLFGPLHCALIAVIVAVTIALSKLAAARRIPITPLRTTLGVFLAADEFVWWVFRYSHEGIHAANLPLQLCDLTVWLSVAACLTLRPAIVEFAYFAGLAGAGMAILTPDLWSPWPSYPAIYFFVAHGGIVIAVSMLVFGRVVPLRKVALWHAFGYLVAYAAALGVFDALSGANYMYLRRKPRGASALDSLGPWPFYLLPGAALALGLFWLLWLPAPKHTE